MAKKPSGLGRGLGDLLEDNTPEIRVGKESVVRREATPTVTPPQNPSSTALTSQGSASETPAGQNPMSTSTTRGGTPSAITPRSGLYSNIQPKSLYETKPKNKSLKSNFKNFNR